MSSTKASNAVLAIARSKFSRHLGPAQMAQMAGLSSVAEVADYLRSNTKFGPFMDSSGITAWKRGSLESVLRRASMEDIYTMCSFEKKIGSPVFSLYMMTLEADEIVRYLRFLAAGQPDKYVYGLPTAIQEIVEIDLVGLSQLRTVDALISFFEEYELYRPIIPTLKGMTAGSLNITPIETNLDRLIYLRSCAILRANFSGQELAELLYMFRLKVETTDLETIYRAKRFFGEKPDIIRSLVIGEGALLSPHQIEELIKAEDDTAFLKQLKNTKYGKQMPDTEQVNSFCFARQQLMKRLVHEIHFSTCPATVTLAYIHYLSMETKNIIHIIEGVRYRLPTDEILGTLNLITGREDT